MKYQMPEPAMHSFPWDEPGYDAQQVQAAFDAGRAAGLEAAAEAATDAIAFNGGTVQMEAHVRDAIRNLASNLTTGETK